MVAMEKCEPKYEPRCRIFFAEGQKFRTNLLDAADVTEFLAHIDEAERKNEKRQRKQPF